MAKCDHVCGVCGQRETGSWMEDCYSRLTSRKLCFSCDHWIKLEEEAKGPRAADVVRVDGGHYMIGDDKGGPSKWRGFGGSRFRVRFHDGRERTTTNLWFQGTIPEHFRERLPDNAVFVDEKTA